MANFQDVLKLAQTDDAFALKLFAAPQKALSGKNLALTPPEAKKLDSAMSRARKGMFEELGKLAGIGRVASTFSGGICC